jgi:geranylgeranyl diphosphate synthase type I
MGLNNLIAVMLPEIELELQRVVARLDTTFTKHFHEMITYHMGWTGEGAGPEATGKRIRPLLVLLTAAACEVDWRLALHPAASLELIHNFSLVHDDIQDQSELRRGRQTIWKKWGIAHAINVGDSLFILAHFALLDIKPQISLEMMMKTEQIINDACLALTNGQFMDMAFEERTKLSIERDYWPMVSGKTAALLSACTNIGALLGGVDDATREVYRSYGHFLGTAFQIRDDYLGIWGNTAMTEKSIESDLVMGKKTLPILYGLNKKGAFAQRLAKGLVQPDEVPYLVEQLTAEGAKMYVQETLDRMTDLAFNSLRLADPKGEAGEVLFELTSNLVGRQN